MLLDLWPLVEANAEFVPPAPKGSHPNYIPPSPAPRPIPLRRRSWRVVQIATVHSGRTVAATAKRSTLGRRHAGAAVASRATNGIASRHDGFATTSARRPITVITAATGHAAFAHVSTRQIRTRRSHGHRLSREVVAAIASHRRNRR